MALPVAFGDIFGELVALLLASAVAGVLSVRLRQPLLVGFIATGILAGPSGLDLIRSADQIHALAEMGLALLLFVVGLKLDLRLIRSMGSVALSTGMGQVVLTALAGLILALGLGLSAPAALYVAAALTFSSTIIIVKLLSDKRETDSLHGRIALGILIVQDVLVVLAMIGLSASAGSSAGHPVAQMLGIVLRGLGLVAGIAAVSLVVLPRLLPLVARSSELLVLSSLAWALGLAGLAGHLGFSLEVGAFLAGVALASTPYRESLGARLSSLRDFMLLFFFLELGSRLDVGLLGAQLLPAVPLSLFVLVGKPILVMLPMRAMGYRSRTSFMTGLAVAQVSEFSLILMAMGADAGHISREVVGMVTLVALVTIGLSGYMILYSQRLYERLAPYLRVFERRDAHREEAGAGDLHGPPADVVLFGLGRYGSGIAAHLEVHERSVLGVDFDPQAVSAWNARGGRAVYGGAEDPEFTAQLPLAHARWVVSSVRDPGINRAIVQALHHAGYRGHVALAADDRAQYKGWKGGGADLLFVPFEDAGEQAVDLLIGAEREIARKAMERTVNALSGHYIVCGFGRMGQQICKDLQRQEVPCVVVEDNPEQLPRLHERAIPHVVGKASADEVLLAAGIKRAKGLIAVAASDQENVFIVLTARVLNPSLFIVARSILEENEDKLRRAGADRVISPYVLGGRRMAAEVTRRGVMDFLDLVLHGDEIDADIAHVVVSKGSPRAHQSLAALGLWQHCGVTVLALRNADGKTIANPCPDATVSEGAELIVMGTPAQIAAAQRLLTDTP